MRDYLLDLILKKREQEEDDTFYQGLLMQKLIQNIYQMMKL